MSSELRVKKLRGSGGYVIAKVTDEDQAKGNLGGPDLFLSPIGRLDPAVILKWYCNTCEGEFESSPSINYESPNEKVADNLVLVEKGQYVCSKCSAVIAEYRTFKKPDENKDPGPAVQNGPQAQPPQAEPAPAQPQAQPPQAEPAPAQPQAPQAEPAPAQPQAPQAEPAPAQPQPQAPQAEPAPAQPQPQPQAPQAEPAPAQPQAPQAEPAPAQPQAQAPQAEPAPAQPQAQAPQAEPAPAQPQAQAEAKQPVSIRPIAGMSVFDENGNMTGTVRDVGVAKDRGIVLLIQAPDGGDAVIGWGRIGKIGEVILLKPHDGTCCAGQPTPAAPATQEPASPSCTKCGFANAAGAKFCEMCGSKV